MRKILKEVGVGELDLSLCDRCDCRGDIAGSRFEWHG